MDKNRPDFDDVVVTLIGWGRRHVPSDAPFFFEFGGGDCWTRS